MSSHLGGGDLDYAPFLWVGAMCVVGGLLFGHVVFFRQLFLGNAPRIPWLKLSDYAWYASAIVFAASAILSFQVADISGEISELDREQEILLGMQREYIFDKKYFSNGCARLAGGQRLESAGLWFDTLCKPDESDGVYSWRSSHLHRCLDLGNFYPSMSVYGENHARFRTTEAISDSDADALNDLDLVCHVAVNLRRWDKKISDVSGRFDSYFSWYNEGLVLFLQYLIFYGAGVKLAKTTHGLRNDGK